MKRSTYHLGSSDQPMDPLTIRNPTQPFSLYTPEVQGCTVKVLTQEPGPQPVTFLFKQLDRTILWWPSYLCTTAAVAVILLESRKSTGYIPLTLCSSHNLQRLVSSSHLTGLLSAPHLLQLYALFIKTPTVTLTLGPDFNPVSHLKPNTNPNPHYCISLIHRACSPFPRFSLSHSRPRPHMVY
ncbi:hypothetical protein AAY473_024063 [Plecturocebus cupreus]